MVTNTKRNEHPACSCRQCRRGSASSAGQFTHAQVNRKIRRKFKSLLAAAVRGALDVEPVVVSTPYTD